MERVTGIGGFFRSTDPSVDPLVRRPHSRRDAAHVVRRAGLGAAGRTTVIAPVADAFDHVTGPGRSWMLNFRVSDLDAMVAQLRSAHIEVEFDPEDYLNGRFANLHDPEGNPIQLKEPGGIDA